MTTIFYRCGLQYWESSFTAPPENKSILSLLRVRQPDNIIDIIDKEQNAGASIIWFLPVTLKERQANESLSDVGRRRSNFKRQIVANQDDIAAWLNRLSESAWKKVHLMGHSLGLLIEFNVSVPEQEMSAMSSAKCWAVLSFQLSEKLMAALGRKRLAPRISVVFRKEQGDPFRRREGRKT